MRTKVDRKYPHDAQYTLSGLVMVVTGMVCTDCIRRALMVDVKCAPAGVAAAQTGKLLTRSASVQDAPRRDVHEVGERESFLRCPNPLVYPAPHSVAACGDDNGDGCADN